jgi:malonyl-CoA O-methyltransferase
MAEDHVLDRVEVRRAFDRAATSYDAHAVLQREVCDRLLERLDFVKLAPARVLDVGAGTGYGTQHLRARYSEADLIALDLAPAMLHAARERFPQPGWAQRALARLTPHASSLTHFLCADLEYLPFKPSSVDLVWSSLALQWANDLEGTLRDFHRVLAPGGLLMFATFGPDTLKELRSAFAAVDAAPHVSRFADLHDIGEGAWRALQAAYEMHRSAGRLPATYEVIYGHAWAGDKSQREDGRQVIRFNIEQRQRKLGLR